MHLKLAPPGMDSVGSSSSTMAAVDSAILLCQKQQLDDQLSQSPGLILWPKTFISIPSAELAMHACKHPSVLIGCKSAITDYVEIHEEDGARFVDEELWDALSEYEGFVFTYCS
jgi:hypothetical protein